MLTLEEVRNQYLKAGKINLKEEKEYFHKMWIKTLKNWIKILKQRDEK